MNKELIGVTLLGFAESIGTFGNLCPTVRDLAAAGRQADPHLRADLNRAYVRSGVIGLSIAAGASVLVGSALPFLAGVAGVALSVANYETTVPSSQRLWAPLLGPPRYPNVIEGTYRVLD